ncbi:rubredoxin, partial [Vulcanococcus sp.]|uniref:rubredoxin n=1 Tax=Vulcanococcus sp. TaxID=2856995 RepID=UPI0037D9A6B6
MSEDPVQEQAPASDVPQDADSVAAPEAAIDDPDTHRFECRSCGFVFDPAEGIKKLAIEPGTPFSAL